MYKYFYTLDEKVDIANVGGKAYNLAKLHKESFLIPETQLLSIKAYNEFFQLNKLQDHIDLIQDQLTGKTTDLELESKIEPLQKLIRNGRMSFPLATELELICKSFNKSEKVKLAVRSSAIMEDLVEHSFAGQFTTVLNVEANIYALQEAVKKVWASQWNRSAVYYHKRMGLSLQNLGMGVIIQKMVQPQISGVLFTVNPKNHNKNELVLEYIRGACEKLVSGRQTPVHLIYNRAKEKFSDEHLVEQRHKRFFKSLIIQALQIEKEFNKPADIEWALHIGKMYFLQYRPITTFAISEAEGILWTNENVGEVIPDVVTPYCWSILESITKDSTVWFLKKLAVKKYPDCGLFSLYKGKVYFNKTEFNKILKLFYISEYINSIREKSINKIKKSTALIFYILKTLWSMLHIGIFTVTLPVKIKRRLNSFQRKLKRIKFTDGGDTRYSYKKSLEILNLQKRTMALHISGTIFAEVYYHYLKKICKEWFAGEPSLGVDDLLIGLNSAESAKSGTALLNLAKQISSNKEAFIIFEKEPIDLIEEKLSKIDNGEEIAAKIEDFINEYGHEALHEFELFYPRWREDKSYIFTNIQNYLKAPGSYDLEEDIKKLSSRRIKNRENAFAHLKGIKNIFRRIFFIYLLKKAEFFSTQRENLKQAFVKAHSELKKHLLDIGKELQKQNIIDNANDILFITNAGIRNLVFNKIGVESIKELIKKRKEKREQYSGEKHPAQIKQVGDVWIPIAVNDKQSSFHLSGIGCSGGTAEGRVNIILSAEDFTQMEKGDILVTRFTNPGWTPLFVLASGIVTEIGGALSHGAIIAREYGIPMIAAVQGATGSLKTGDRILVNGNTGEIQLLTKSEKGKNG